MNSLVPPLLRGVRAGLFHSQENKGFVGVVRPLLPVPTPATNDRMRVWDPRAGTGARPLQRMKQPWGVRGDLDFATNKKDLNNAAKYRN
ncbi:MAG TPA: hypothetical protein DD001_15780 [Microcoleaceae bacterium UBA10368]|nr:hypothetical protein [Microcoleaceae cyanobacterium UBA10368]